MTPSLFATLSPLSINRPLPDTLRMIHRALLTLLLLTLSLSTAHSEEEQVLVTVGEFPITLHHIQFLDTNHRSLWVLTYTSSITFNRDKTKQ